MPYYEENIKQCSKECPKEKPYKMNSYICTNKCQPNVIDYESKECVVDCSFNQKWAINSKEEKFCLEKCNRELGEYLSIDRQCVKECDTEKNLVKNIIDPTNKK